MNTIHNCDVRDALVHLQDKADCIMTDPPYKLTAGGDTKCGMDGGCFDSSNYDNNGKIVTCDITWQEIMVTCYNMLKPNCHAYIMCNNRNMEEALREARFAGFLLHNILVWDKGTATANRWYMNKVEFCLLLYKKPAKKIHDKGLSNIFSAHEDALMFNSKNKKGNGHPTQKPVELMECWIKQSTKPGDLVIDPFMGVGSTILAAINLNLDYIGVEIDKKWYEIAKQRIIDVRAEPKLF